MKNNLKEVNKIPDQCLWERIPDANCASPWDVEKFNSLSLCNKLQSLENIMHLFKIKNIGNYLIFNITSSKTARSLEITIYFTLNTSYKTVFKRTCEITKDMPNYIQIHDSEIEDKTQKLVEGAEQLFVNLMCDNSDRKLMKLYHKAADGSLKTEIVYLQANKAGFGETKGVNPRYRRREVEGLYNHIR